MLVSSHEGEGSTFVLRLPISLVVAESSADGAPTDSHEPTALSIPSHHEQRR